MHLANGVSSERIQARWAAILPTVLFAGLILPSFYWILCDHSVWPYDQAWYGEVALDLWYALTHDPLQWPKIMLRAFYGTKAPGIAWIGQFFVPIGQMSGSIEVGLLLSILFAQFGTLMLSYRIGLEISGGDRLIGLAGSVFMAAAPLFIALSNQYFAEPLQLFAVTYFFWIASTAYRSDRAAILTHLVLATALAMAAKVSSPLYCLLPGVIAIFYFFRAPHWMNRKPGSLLVWRILILLLSIVLLFITAWYVKNWEALVAFVKQTSSGDVSLDYGAKNAFFNKAAFWLSAMRANFFFPQVLFGFGVLCLVTFLSIFRNKSGLAFLKGRTTIIPAAGMAHITAVLVVFSCNVNEEQRYLLPLLPSLLVMLIWFLSHAPKRWFSIVAILIAAGQFAVVQAQALNFIPRNPAITYWIKNPNPDSQWMETLPRLIDLTCTASTQNRRIICGVQYPWLNGNSLAFYAAKARLKTNHRCDYLSLGYAEKDSEHASWQWLEQKKIVYFLSLEEQAQPMPPDSFNQVSVPILERIQADPRFVHESFNSNLPILVFRNIQEALP